MRIDNHPVLDFKKGERITFSFEGEKVPAYEGDTIAAALYNRGIRVLSLSPKKQRPRGFFCAIGKCSSCLMRVNGLPNVRTCVTLAKEGMVVGRENGYPKLPLSNEPPVIRPLPTRETEIVVIGGGPAGLRAALSAAEAGASVFLIDENPRLGGQLVKQTHKFFGSSDQDAGKRGFKIAKELVKAVKEHVDVTIRDQSTAIGIYEGNLVGVYKKNERLERIKAKKIVFATGASEDMVIFKNDDLPGVYGAGGVQTLMNVYGIKPAEEVLMVGAGNVGLIVSYQLLQAGVNVKAIIEALPKIGGYYVHAAKVRRQGVPILTKHTITGVEGGNKVKKATIAKISKSGEIIGGSEKELEVDAVTLAVGLSPSYRLVEQSRAKLKFVPHLGGYVPFRNENMMTTQEDIYVAGDMCGVEEATTALLEGEIAGRAALLALGYGGNKQVNRIQEAREELGDLRSGSFYEHIRYGLEEVCL